MFDNYGSTRPESDAAPAKSDTPGRIRCPLCRWQPGADARWMCSPVGYPEFFDSGCGTVWNTFMTRGLCPGCGHQWEWTMCLQCLRPSRHVDWYVDDS